MDSSGLPIPIGGSKPLSAVLQELNSRGLRFPVPPQTRDVSFASPGEDNAGVNPGDATSSSHLNAPDFLGSEFQPSQGNNGEPKSDQLPTVGANTDPTDVSSFASFGVANVGSSDVAQMIQIRGSGNTSSTEHQQLQGQQLQAAVVNREQLGQSSASNVQQLQNLTTKFGLQKEVYQNDCQLLLNSVKSSLHHRSTKNQNDPQQLSASMRKPGTSKQIKTGEPQGSLGARNQHSGQPGSSQHQHRVPPLPSLPPTAASAHMNLLHRMQNQKSNPKKRPLLGKQSAVEKQVVSKVLPKKSSVNSDYKPGRGAERLKEYMLQQRNRPRDNNIQFWRNLVSEFFAPSAKKRWCVSSYKNIEQIDSLFKAAWQCGMCNVKPCCGFEISEELLPRLHKMKYDVGMLEEHLHIDTPIEHQGKCGQIFLHCPKATEEREHEQTRIEHYGQLCVIFSPDLKICFWEFCAQNHGQYICRNSIIPQACQLGVAIQNYQLSTQDSSSFTSEEKQKHADMFISSAYQMVEALGVSSVSQIGIVKRYVPWLQISEVLNLMNDLIDYSQENGLAPKESIAKFPRFGSNISSRKNSNQQPEQQQLLAAFSAPCFQTFPGAGSSSKFCGDGLGNTTALTSNGPICEKQHTGEKNPHAETPTQTTTIGFSPPPLGIQPQLMYKALGKSGTESAVESMQLETRTSVPLQQPCPSNFVHPNDSLSTVERIMQEVMAASSDAETQIQTTSIGFTTPIFSMQPQLTHAALGKSGTDSAVKNVRLEPKTSLQQPCPSNLADPNGSRSTVERIIPEATTAQPQNAAGGITGVNIAENLNKIMPAGRNAIGNNSSGGNLIATNEITYIDVQNFAFKNTGISFSAPATEPTSRAQMDMDMDTIAFPKDVEGNYLPKEYNDQLNDEFVDFQDLHELLK